MKADTAEIGTIRFEPVAESHFPLLRQWLSQPHVREWWGEPETELGHIRVDRSEENVEGFVFSCDERPAGYIQHWQPRGDEEEEWPKQLPPGTYGIDMFIGPADMIEKGVGGTVLRAFAGRLFEQGALRLVIDPDPRNTRAIRAYEKVGFRPFMKLEGDNGSGGALLMELLCDEENRRTEDKRH